MRKAAQSPFRRRQSKHARKQRVKRRAPRHPVAPEAQLRLATAHLFERYHAHVRDAFKAVALAYAGGRLRRSDAADASDAPTTRDPMLQSVFSSVWSFATNLLHTSPYKRIVAQASKDTAKSAKDQTAKALGLEDFDPNMSDVVDDLSNNILDGVTSLMGDSIERAADVLDEWAELDPDRSERAGDVDALGDMLDDGLQGISGKGLAAVAIAFGLGFAASVAASHKAAGVGHYAWMAQHDSVVRPEHLALDDGSAYDWDDPPLKGDDSSSGDDCNPGEDYNCRCVASPIPDDELDEFP